MDAYLTQILFGGFVLLLLLGAPITVALGGAGMAAYIVLDKDPIALVQIAFNSVGSFPLMALPAFVLAGALMEAAGISRRLVDIAESLAGPITGGLGVATVLACLFFGAISGSGPATTAAVGMLMIPAMTRRNYDRAYASAITAASGGLGIIIPPSIPMVIFGIAALGMQPPPEAVERFGTF
nr:TRAP transporter large permease subunit [Rubrivivax sp.]